MRTMPCLLVVCGLSVSIAFASNSPEVNFDGPTDGDPASLENFAKGQKVKVLNESMGRVGGSIKITNTLPNGDKVALPTRFIGTDTKLETWVAYPTQDTTFTFSCNTPPEKERWRGCLYFDFQPGAVGHAHQPAGPLNFYSPHTGNLLPNPVCVESEVDVSKIISLKAPVYSSYGTYTATLSGACEGEAQGDFVIGIGGLEEVKADSFLKLKKPREEHPLSYWGTPDTNAKLRQIALEYRNMFPKDDPLVVTEMSLPLGGRFSVDGDCWTEGRKHFFHRYGRQADVRITSIPVENRACLTEIACKYFVHPLIENKDGLRVLSDETIPFFRGMDPDGTRADELDSKFPHYHFNFVRPTDPPRRPPDHQYFEGCPPVEPAKSACPNPIAGEW